MSMCDRTDGTPAENNDCRSFICDTSSASAAVLVLLLLLMSCDTLPQARTQAAIQRSINLGHRQSRRVTFVGLNSPVASVDVAGTGAVIIITDTTKRTT